MLVTNDVPGAAMLFDNDLKKSYIQYQEIAMYMIFG